MTRHQDSITMLAAADPAAGLSIDVGTREEVWRILAASIAATPDRSHSPRPHRRPLLRAPALAVAALLALAGVALATGLIGIGSPARKIENFQIPDSAYGTIVPGSARILSVTAADPHGGPPWGLRVFTTTRGAGCIQAGRVLDGQLGVLGTDGAFGDDGQLHPLSVATASELTCAALDANGRIFNNISKGNQLANGLIGPEQVPSSSAPVAHEICAAAVASPAEKSSALGRICPQSEERDLYYGLLGPEAESVTFKQEGRSVTVPTTGVDGAYLIVTDAPASWQPNDAYGPGATGVLPVYSPITEIRYSNGAVCHLGTPGDPACAPNGLPTGYAAATQAPTASQAAATVTSRLVASSGGGHEAIVTFKAPVAITTVRDHYKLKWQKPSATGALEESAEAGEGDITAGHEITVHARALESGSTQLQVVLEHASGPALLEGPGTVYIPVGATTVTVP